MEQGSLSPPWGKAEDDLATEEINLPSRFQPPPSSLPRDNTQILRRIRPHLSHLDRATSTSAQPRDLDPDFATLEPSLRP
ncbi:hypothetical protein CRG98_002912 [Punica granatum]|uniref:Uncharacterized protein n=1 Tax=Punica granatum TaxID=22663 RepID=A0A2I0L7I9_PUNGR|nr:hypothetical protein CRG98_002912 [Punica granatum]